MEQWSARLSHKQKVAVSSNPAPATLSANGVTVALPHGVGTSGIIARNTEDDV